MGLSSIVEGARKTDCPDANAVRVVPLAEHINELRLQQVQPQPRHARRLRVHSGGGVAVLLAQHARNVPVRERQERRASVVARRVWRRDEGGRDDGQDAVCGPARPELQVPGCGQTVQLCSWTRSGAF